MAMSYLAVGVMLVAMAGTHTAWGQPQSITPCTGDCSSLVLESGTIHGVARDSVTHFLGVPYAKPPLGDLRWEPPQPAEPWTGVRNATAYSKACMQSDNVYDKIAGGVSEDCLYLNMWVPSAAGSAGPAQYPIMIFFHGGSYITGSAMIPVYNGKADVKAFKDVILIAANYRLGLMGYLGSDQLRASDNSTGCFGLQDQRRVMQWAHDNAAAFHGDPNRITIFGESAGAGSVSNHLVAPKSAGLFHGAIMESGPVVAQWVAQPMEVAEHQFATLAASVGCTGPGAATCLRGVNASVLEAHKPSCKSALLDWAPTVDGVELTAHPRDLLAKGLAHDVPVILGTNRNEGTEFVDMSQTANDSLYALTIESEFGSALGSQILQQYPTSRYEATKGGTAAWWALTDVWGDVAMTCAAHDTVRQLASTPGRNSSVFLYAFQHELDVLSALDYVQKNHAFGCCHASELPLVFHIDEMLIGPEKDMSEQVVKFWETFASTGSPGTSWPAWQPSQPTALVWDVVDHKASFVPSISIKASDCNFWSTRLAQVPPSFFYGACVSS
eukprot:m.22098 g.22098  ORF g.22098 m.22098 type:complete len:555 (+) comp3954_c0_seq1:100-1764(+)